VKNEKASKRTKHQAFVRK